MMFRKTWQVKKRPPGSRGEKGIKIIWSAAWGTKLIHLEGLILEVNRAD